MLPEGGFMRRLVVRLSAARLAAAAVFCCSGGLIFSSLVTAGETALDRYVAKPDKTYAWKIVGQSPGMGGTHIIVDLKSQTWRSPKEVNRTVWQHWLNIVRPEKPVSNIAFLFIDGGSNGDKRPQKIDPLVAMIAAQTNAVVAELKMVPNEPLIFNNDGVKRK
jgi:PhoPQ-activated pathogenicity-related protein